jgi:chromosome segregation ATPase
MSVDFSAFLSLEEKKSLLEQRIKQFASEGWQHQLNRAAFEANGDTEAVAATDTAIATISNAIEAHQSELTLLED